MNDECLPLIKLIFKAPFSWAPNHDVITFQGFLNSDRYQLLATCNHQTLGPDHHNPRPPGLGVLWRRLWGHRALPSAPSTKSIFLPSLIFCPLLSPPQLWGWICPVTTIPTQTPKFLDLLSPGLGPLMVPLWPPHPGLGSALYAPYDLTLLLRFSDTHSLYWPQP